MRGGAQSPGSKTVTQLPAPRGSSDSGSARHMERGSLVAWEASGRCGEMAVHSFTAQQQLVVTTFDHCALGSGDTGSEPLPVSVWAVVLQHSDTVGGLGGITAQELGLWRWSLDPGKHQARSFLAAFSLLHGPHHGFSLSTQNLSPDKIFHVIVAPCYDKKLEALQEDVPTASRGSRGTDCVLTSGEGGGPRERPLGGQPVHRPDGCCVSRMRA